LLQPLTIYLPSNQVNTVTFVNSYSASTCVNWLRSIKVPIANSVEFLKTKSDVTLTVIGDSTAECVSSATSYTATYNLECNYLGWNLALLADGSVALNSNTNQIVNSVVSSKPSIIEMAHWINNWLYNTPSNTFYSYYSSTMDMTHAALPGVPLLANLGNPIVNEGQANTAGLKPSDYRNIIKIVASTRPFITVLDPTGWYASGVNTGLHPLEFQNVGRAQFEITNHENVVLNYRPAIQQGNYYGFLATNNPANGNALRYTNGAYYWAP
jgi:hypothetical protein